MHRALLATAALFAALAFPATSTAHKAIKGYTFCGTKDFETGGWHYGASDGAYLDSYARGMSCAAARRNVDRTKHRRTPPYAPYRTGYRCREVASAHEYSSVRCVKIGSTTVAYRYLTGA